jgi:hypothetical protein
MLRALFAAAAQARERSRCAGISYLPATVRMRESLTFLEKKADPRR